MAWGIRADEYAACGQFNVEDEGVQIVCPLCVTTEGLS